MVINYYTIFFSFMVAKEDRCSTQLILIELIVCIEIYRANTLEIFLIRLKVYYSKDKQK